MRYVSDIVAKNDPIALYYKLMIEKKIDDKSQHYLDSKDKIKQIFKVSPDWRSKTEALGLNYDQL